MELKGYLEEHGVNWRDPKAIAAHPDIASEAMFSAKRLMEKTFFKYDALGMPKMFSKLGPAGRLLFQFKPFIIQATGYEYDLWRAAIQNKPEAWGQLGRHVGMLAALGGATGLMAHPIISYLGALVKFLTPGRPDVIHMAGHSIPLNVDGLEAISENARQQSMTGEERINNTMRYRWQDLLNYGILGSAFHVATGNRLGVSGQDITPDFSDFPHWLVSEAGPTFSLYPQLAQAWGKYLSTGRGTGRAMLGGAAGMLASHLISSKLTGGAPLPFSGATGGLVGAWLASKSADNPFGDFLFKSKEGKQLVFNLVPAMARNAYKTWEIYNHGNITNLDGEPQQVPYENRTEEMAAMLAGFSTIRREEYQAVNSFENSLAASYNTTREIVTNSMAVALKEGNTEEAWRIFLKAQHMGVYIPESAVQTRLQDLTQEAMTTMQQHQNAVTRYTQP